jgi:xylulose-5-phosphate/fructose-6-phosphate phosphoketolase
VAGDTPTLETLAAAKLLRDWVPYLRVRVVNVVDLMALLPANDHPHGFSDQAFNDMFTSDTDVVFAFHGYPRAIHELLHGRVHPGRFHVRGFNEQGTTTTAPGVPKSTGDRISTPSMRPESFRR